MLSKAEIRTLMRQRALTFRDGGEAAADVWHQVEELPEFVSSSRILIYISLPGEVQTRPFIDRWHGRKQFVLPRVCCGEQDIEPHLELRLYSPDFLVSGYRGIKEPSDDAPLVAPADVELALIPGVAFARTDAGALRLGRGGGFYDRLLPLLTCPAIGVCLSYRLLDSLPVDTWDAPLTKVIANR